MRKRTIKDWFLKLRKDGVRRRFLQWMISVILPHHHLAANGGRKKKGIDEPMIVSFDKEIKDEQIS